jgi:putative endonuclease
MSKTPYFTYIVLCADNTLYTGIATNVERRVDEHNSSPKGAKYTKARRPVILVYSEKHPDRSSASKCEYKIKKMSRKEKRILINIEL